MTEKEKMRISMLAEVATMYYERGLTQEEIAKNFCVSRTSISRMLAAASEKGIIQVHINYQFERHYELERQISERFPVKKVCVFNNRGKSRSEIEYGTGSLAASVLKEALVPDVTVGVAWGNTLSTVVNCLELPTVAPDGVEVIQLTGAVSGETAAGCSQSIVSKLSEKIPASPIFLNAPLLVENARLRSALMEEPNNARALRRGAYCDIALTGIGSRGYLERGHFEDAYMTPNYAKELLEKGGIGELCGRFFDKDGKELNCAWNKRVVGLPLAELARIPNVICVSYHPEKAPAMLAALRGKLIHTLITDGTTATKLLNLSR